MHSSEKLGNGQTLELTESKKNGKFFVKIDGRPVSSWKTKEAAQKEFDAYKNGGDPSADRYNEIVGEYNKKHPENPMETKEPENRSAASSEEKKRLKNVPGYSVYRDGESRNGYYREYRNGDDIIRYDQNGYDDRAEGKKYSAMESGPGGKRRFFNSLQEAADWIKKGSPRNAAPAASSQDAAYTAESVNAPRENLERKLTGDCKIKIRK